MHFPHDFLEDLMVVVCIGCPLVQEGDMVLLIWSHRIRHSWKGRSLPGRLSNDIFHYAREQRRCEVPKKSRPPLNVEAGEKFSVERGRRTTGHPRGPPCLLRLPTTELQEERKGLPLRAPRPALGCLHRPREDPATDPVTRGPHCALTMELSQEGRTPSCLPCRWP